MLGYNRTMRQPASFVAVLVSVFSLVAGCSERAAPSKTRATPAAAESPPARPTLAEARRGFSTTVQGEQPEAEPVPVPPENVFRRVKYPAGPREFWAYVTPDPADGRKHPAIVWLTGGDTNSIGPVWWPASPDNDQTAAAYRQAGIVMMFPSLRGGNDNPGKREGFLGEVDDVLAAAAFLAAQPYVDPERIYLGGHSTGGTLAMLVAEVSPRFRAVFAFGPVADVRTYGGHYVYHDLEDEQETRLRSPGYWLDSVRSPLFVIEGTEGNIDALRWMRSRSSNPLVSFVEVPGMTHFNILAPTNQVLAAKILASRGSNRITLSAREVLGNSD